jgi:PhnB protein
MTTPAPLVQPYLFFGGRCDEALAFYQTAIGAEIGMVMRFDQSPDPMPEGMLEPGFEKKVMHSEFKVGAMTLMASDGCGSKDGGKFDGFRLALVVPTEAAAHQAYDGLAAGGTADMPLNKTFWSPCYGMVTDQFGLGWMVMVPSPM